MAHRDDREAARGRIEALERELADARRDAEAARADAAAAKEEKERIARAGTAAAPARARGSARNADAAWRGRTAYTRGVGLLSLAVFGATGLALATLREAALEMPAILALGAVVLALPVGTWILGSACDAPEAFGGMLVTLILAPIPLGIAGICTSDDVLFAVPDGAPRLVARLLIALAAAAVGAAIGARWIPDAASREIQGD